MCQQSLVKLQDIKGHENAVILLKMKRNLVNSFAFYIQFHRYIKYMPQTVKYYVMFFAFLSVAMYIIRKCRNVFLFAFCK